MLILETLVSKQGYHQRSDYSIFSPFCHDICEPGLSTWHCILSQLLPAPDRTVVPRQATGFHSKPVLLSNLEESQSGSKLAYPIVDGPEAILIHS